MTDETQQTESDQRPETDQGAQQITTIRVWDIPVRLFHWLLVAAICTSVYTGEFGGFAEMDYHVWSGYLILGLVLFRITWGFVGSYHARFSSFIRPSALLPYARSLPDRESTPSVGHNPLGGLSVVALLLSAGLQAVTGLFANDDIFFEGPLAHLVSGDTSDLMTSIHHWNLWVLYTLAGMHLTAIAAYEIYKRQRLVLPMLTGKKHLPLETEAEADSAAGQPAPLRELAVGTVCGLVIAGGLYYLLNHL